MAAGLSVHLAGVRAGVDAYRDRVVAERAAPSYAEWFERAREVDGWTLPTELSLLYHLALHAPDEGRVAEIGSYLGRSTIVLAGAVRELGGPPVAAIDPHTAALGIEDRPPRDTRGEFLENIERAGVSEHVELFHALSTEAAKTWRGEPIRMLFVDGWHTREAVLEDVRSYAPWLTPRRVVVFDDFMVMEGVRQGVFELRDEGLLPGEGAIAGKMAVFAPAETLAAIPLPPGGRMLGRVIDRLRAGGRAERLIQLGDRTYKR